MVVAIEQAIGQSEGRKIEYDKKLKHLRTGAMRQFDAVVTFGSGHHEVVTAIECKDHGRPIDVGTVEAFARKVEGCPVNRGIMVSSNGYTDDARKVAADAKITTMTLQDAEQFDWISLAGDYVQHERQIDHIEARLDFDPPEPDIDALFARGAKFVDGNDIELDTPALANIVHSLIPWRSSNQEVAPGSSRSSTKTRAPTFSKLMGNGGDLSG